MQYPIRVVAFGDNTHVADRRDALRPLTSLRFFAALLVFFTHAPGTRPIAVVLGLGYAGVGFFYLLSGFILTYTYWRDFHCSILPESVRRFYVARIARVYPVHLVTMCLMLAFLASFGGDFWTGISPRERLAAIVAQTLLVQSWAPAPEIRSGVNAPAWSISVEVLFYALFPLFAFCLLRLLRGLRQRWVLLVAAAVWATLFFAELPLRSSFDDWLPYSFPPSRLPDFIVGMLLGIAFLRRGTTPRYWLRPTSVESLAIGFVVIATCLSPIFPISVRFATLLMPFSAFVISVFARQQGAISRLLSARLFVRLGEVSFAFYLVHLVTIYAVKLACWPALPTIIVSFTTSLALSFALFHFIEQPLRVWIRRTFSQPLVAS